jgi:hypothetical protein
MNFNFTTSPGGRSYLYKDKDPFKLIPKKYTKHFNVIDFVCEMVDPSKRRLTTRERFNLEYKIFLKTLKITEKFVYQHIYKLTPYKALHVIVKGDDNRYELKFSNSYTVKIPKHLFMLFDEKEVKHSNY